MADPLILRSLKALWLEIFHATKASAYKASEVWVSLWVSLCVNGLWGTKDNRDISGVEDLILCGSGMAFAARRLDEGICDKHSLV